MLNVLLVCSMGASTGALCDKIKKEAEAEGYDINIWASPLAMAGDEYGKADIVLLGPQVKFMKNKVQEEIGDKPLDDIDMRTYGMMDAKAVFETIKKMSENL